MGKTGERLFKLFWKYAPLSIADAQQLTGLHPARIQRHVRPPYYRRVACEWATRRWEWRWAPVVERCDCGQPAWWQGRAMMIFSNVQREEKFLLCNRCAKNADPKMKVSPLWTN